MGKDPYERLSWMTDEMKAEMRKQDQMVLDEDMEGLFLLSDNADFSIVLHQILVNRYDKDPNSLNPIQMNLFLCMHLENAGQADSILSFLQEWFPEQQKQIVKSLNEIGATKSAEIIKQAIGLLPKNGEWFYKNSDENAELIMSGLDRDFSDYPDGSMRDLYRKYAEKHKKQISEK